MSHDETPRTFDENRPCNTRKEPCVVFIEKKVKVDYICESHTFIGNDFKGAVILLNRFYFTFKKSSLM